MQLLAAKVQQKNDTCKYLCHFFVIYHLYRHLFEGVDAGFVVGPRELDVVLGEAIHYRGNRTLRYRTRQVATGVRVYLLGLPEDGGGVAIMLGVESGGLAGRDSVQEFTAAFAFALRNDLEVHLQHTRVGAFGIGEDMQLAHRQRFDEVHIFAPALLGLSAHADHTVHADKSMRHDRFDMGYALGKQFTGLTASHDFEDGVTAALQRDMKMRGEMTAVRHKVDNLIAQQVRLAAGDANAVIRNW